MPAIVKRTLWCAAASLAIGLWSIPSPALAAFHYPFLGQLTGFPTARFGSADSVAIDEKTAETLVADWASGEIKVYDATGRLVASWNGSAQTNPPGAPTGSFGGGEVSLAVNDSTGDIYVADGSHGVVDILKANGEYVGQVTGAPLSGRVAVGIDQSSGYIYVSEVDQGAVDVFNAKGEYQYQLSGYEPKGAFSIAVDDQTGKILVAESFPKTVSLFNIATGAYETTWNGSEATNPPGTPQGGFGGGVVSVAVDQSTGHVYVTAAGVKAVDEFNGAGGYVGQVTGTPSGEFSFPFGIAVDQTTRDIFFGDPEQGVVDIFGAGILLPGVTTGAVESVRETGATFTGTINPEGKAVTSCEFEYGASSDYGHKQPCGQTLAQIGSGTSPVAVSAEVNGLEAGAFYHYRLVAGNAAGTEYASAKWFIPTNERFGFPLEGPNAFSVVVSNSEVPSGALSAGEIAYPSVANPNDLDTQAGSHPFAATVSFHLKTTVFDEMTGEQYVKDIAVGLPAGVSGSIVSVPQCAMYDLSNPSVGCPTSSQVGTVVVWQSHGENSPAAGLLAPVYNMAPSDGGTAELSFPVGPVAQPVIVKVRTDGDYGLVSMTTNISEGIPFSGLTLTLWGDPADPRHDAERFLPTEGGVHLGYIFGGRRPGNEKIGPNGWGEPLPDGAPRSAYLTNPTHCGGAIDATIMADSWDNPGRFNPVNGMPDLSDPKWVTATTPMYPEVTGCNKLRFNPSITVTPDTTKANSPSGYAINLHVPQSTNPNDLATPALENAVATLPQGLAINPGAADGLQACTSNAAEPPGSPGNEIGLKSNVEPTCPATAQVGSVEVKTPLLPDILYGQIYLSSEHEGNKYGIFIVIRGDGLLIKLHSTVVADSVTGQLTASFLDNPELPFSDFTMHFYGGPRAVFVNPAVCGPATTTTDLTSWGSEPGGLADMTPASTFDVSFDGLGAPCPNPQPFAPQFTAGTTSIQAGGFSPLTTTFSRADEDQLVNHVQVTAPPGLLGTLRDVPLCPEPQASQGTCSAASKIGHTIIGVGSGAAPLYLPVPGQPEQPVYVTGPYRGAPFGLTFVVPAVAGPYDLGRVVVRAAITVDPRTAQLTVTSDPLPTIIDGIPVQVKTVNVVIDRPDFVFNPTSCAAMGVGGAVTSLQGSTATLSSPFEVTGCGDLKFKPIFKVATSGHTSRASGASLDAKLFYPPGALGKDANIAGVKVELPKQLPSRLTTLQKACTDSVFNANPADCPAASRIGFATATTPILPVELSGPAYFVSHGGAKFPELIIVLQGEGVRVDLHGETFINKAGITSTTFTGVPDVPVESFELKLPSGPDSVLAANGDLCADRLTMPTTFTAQNGAKVQEQTPISVQGCRPEIRVLRHSVKAKRATISVSVPSAGTLLAGGHGLSAASKQVRGAGVVTVTLRLSRADQHFVTRHHGRRLMAPIRLSFRPTSGQRLQAQVAVLIR